MRTSSDIIKRIAHFVLKENACMYPFDKFRVKEVALAVRHTISSDQSDNDVRLSVEDLSNEYCQARSVIKHISVSSITIR